MDQKQSKKFRLQHTRAVLSKAKNAYLVQNAQKLADLFCVMLKEPFHSLNVLTDLPPMSKKEQKRHVKFVSDFFLNSIKEAGKIYP